MPVAILIRRGYLELEGEMHLDLDFPIYNNIRISDYIGAIAFQSTFRFLVIKILVVALTPGL